MKKLFILTALFAIFGVASSFACTNLIVTKKASTDGSIMVSYSADSHQIYGALYNHKGQTHKKGEKLKIHEWDTGKYLGEIDQVARTYSTVGNVNEHQLVIAETTYGGRKELVNKEGIMDYGSLIYITLQRAKTAREAINMIVDLTNRYGYASSGESFSIADKNEVWIMELIGKGDEKGIVWVARRIPDGYISAHANHARITQFPMNDPENCMYSPDVITFARKKGYFNGKDEEFSFSDTYAPLSFMAMRGCEARVWSFFNMFADGMDKYLDYAMGHNESNRMPLWVKPSKKISPKNMFDAMRDHYEGTPMDMTKDIGAGGEECPYRWRPMTFKVDGKEYMNERAIATQQSGFWFVAQTRDWLPDPVGCVNWFAVDDPGTSCVTPIYCGTTEVPENFRVGNGHMTEYSPTSAFWLFNRIAQFAYLRYNVVGAAVRKVADKWENDQLARVAELDKKAAELYKQSPAKAVECVTNFSVKTAGELFDKWSELDKYLLVKFIDGNVKKENENGFIDNGNGQNIPEMPDMPGYNDTWKRAVVKDHGTVIEVK